MGNMGHLALLIGVMIALFTTHCHGMEPVNNRTRERVFVIFGEYKDQLTLKIQPFPKTAHEFHRLAGRETRSQIIQEGRRALDHFKNKFGLDLSDLITDDAIYNGTDVVLGNVTFTTLTVAYNVNPYRLVMESNGKKARFYENPPLIKEIILVLLINEQFKAGGTYNKTLYPGEYLLWGDYIFTTPRGLNVIHFRNNPMTPFGGGHGIIKHRKYGKGFLQLSIVKHDDGITRAVNVLRFPRLNNTKKLKL
ncbi:unnamed protein product [Owenia fusiformis]|uniref:Shell matrix protein n=1 Tax=Owenia fusiformis TaxID=6347 RepID=A0A8S4NRI3_OWEFU|nr:unnamed protein product [Owenia fusiformis]